MNKVRKLFIIDSVRKNVDRLEEYFMQRPDLLVEVSDFAYTRSQFMGKLASAQSADLFLISAYLPDTNGVDLLQEIKGNASLRNAKTIVTVDKNTRNLASAAMGNGADKTLNYPFGASSLISAIDELCPASPLSRPQEPAKPSRPVTDFIQKNPLIESLKHRETPKDPEIPHKVISFVSTGGSGKTTMVVNTAYAIWKNAKNQPSICIVDLDLLFPSVLYKYAQEDIKDCEKDIYDISEDLNYLDDELIKKALMVHEPTGIHILKTPMDPESIHKSDFVKAEHIEKILVHLKRMFHVVLIDTSTNIKDDTTLFPLQLCDEAVVIFEPDLASIMSTHKLLYILKSLYEETEEDFFSKFTFVLNKESKRNTVNDSSITPLLYDNDVHFRIPEDPDITLLSNKARFVVEQPSPASLPILELTRKLYPIDPTPTKAKTPFALPSVPSLFRKNQK